MGEKWGENARGGEEWCGRTAGSWESKLDEVVEDV